MKQKPKNVRREVLEFLKAGFADMLGDDVNLLESESGLATIYEKYCLKARRRSS